MSHYREIADAELSARDRRVTSALAAYLATCWHCDCEIPEGDNCGGQFEDCCESCATSAYYAAEQARARDE